MYAYLEDSIVASSDLPRLAPNSITGLFWAASVILLLAVVYNDAELKYKSNAVSISCASIIFAFTVITGSFGNTTVPSGIAYISPVNFKFFK